MYADSACEMKCYCRLLNEKWQQKIMNEVIHKRVKDRNIKQVIMERKLNLFGHICRMSDDRLIKTIVFGNMDGTSRRGRPATISTTGVGCVCMRMTSTCWHKTGQNGNRWFAMHVTLTGVEPMDHHGLKSVHVCQCYRKQTIRAELILVTVTTVTHVYISLRRFHSSLCFEFLLYFYFSAIWLLLNKHIRES